MRAPGRIGRRIEQDRARRQRTVGVEDHLDLRDVGVALRHGRRRRPAIEVALGQPRVERRGQRNRHARRVVMRQPLRRCGGRLGRGGRRRRRLALSDELGDRARVIIVRWLRLLRRVFVCSGGVSSDLWPRRRLSALLRRLPLAWAPSRPGAASARRAARARRWLGFRRRRRLGFGRRRRLGLGRRRRFRFRRRRRASAPRRAWASCGGSGGVGGGCGAGLASFSPLVIWLSSLSVTVSTGIASGLSANFGAEAKPSRRRASSAPCSAVEPAQTPI